MSSIAVSVDEVWKSFRLYHERNQYLKAALLRGRRARYEEFWALKGVSFEVSHGETFGIIGSNGSGKSTLLKCLAGILFPERGKVSANGRLSALLELGAGFHPELTGVENVYLNGAILGMSRKEIARRFDDIVSFAGLEQFIDTPVKNYSSGMTVRLGFAIAANVEPEILLIDEVLSVGDESFQRRCMEKIEQFRQDGRTIVFVSHGLAQVEQLCERAAWIEYGNLEMLGPATEVVQRYTGASHGARDESADYGSRWGSGEAQIKAVRLLDESGSPVTVLRTGQRASVRVEFEAHMPLRDVVVGMAINHLHGQALIATNTRRRGVTIDLVEGPCAAQFDFDRLPLLEGTYELTIALTDHTEVHPFDHWDKKVRFEVDQSGVYDNGLVLADGGWSVETRTTRPPQSSSAKR
ncbi:MAG TPA: ABC transporter ATP-binding protein [Ilumatobacteraceae bacterium]